MTQPHKDRLALDQIATLLASVWADGKLPEELLEEVGTIVRATGRDDHTWHVPCPECDSTGPLHGDGCTIALDFDGEDQ